MLEVVVGVAYVLIVVVVVCGLWVVVDVVQVVVVVVVRLVVLVVVLRCGSSCCVCAVVVVVLFFFNLMLSLNIVKLVFGQKMSGIADIRPRWPLTLNTAVYLLPLVYLTLLQLIDCQTCRDCLPMRKL